MLAYNPYSWELWSVYLVLCGYVTSIALTVVATIAKTEEVISNVKFEATSASAFVIATALLIHSGTKVLVTKYGAALSDCVGRKPIIVLSCISFVLSRVILVHANSEAGFYCVAVVWGIMDCTYPVCEAWVCDLVSVDERGRCLGLLIGIGFGMGFSIGLPVGAIITQKVNANTAIWSSIVVCICTAILAAIVPVVDTYGIKSVEPIKTSIQISNQGTTDVVHVKHSRGLPLNWTKFLIEQNPLSALHIIQQGSGSIYDWYSYISGQLCQRVLQSYIILYMQDVVHVNQTQAGIALMFVSLGVVIFAPALLARFFERFLFFFGACNQIFAYIILSVASVNSVNKQGRIVLLLVSLFFLAFGSVWGPACTTLVTSQYSQYMQGEVLGITSQIQEISTTATYPVGVLFAYTLKSNASIRFSGIIWLIAATFLLIGIGFQLQSNPASDVIAVKRRPPKSEVAPNIASIHENEEIEKSIFSSDNPLNTM